MALSTDSPMVNEQFAINKTKAYFKDRDKVAHTTAQGLFRMLDNIKVSPKTSKRVLKLIRKQCPHMVRVAQTTPTTIVFYDVGCSYCAYHKDDGYTTTDILIYQTVLHKQHRSTTLTAVSWHAMKRLYERYPDMRQLGFKDMSRYLCTWVSPLRTIMHETIKPGHIKLDSPDWTLMQDGIEARGHISRMQHMAMPYGAYVKTFI